jgi:CBS domain containing-hemolysin-like protein
VQLKGVVGTGLSSAMSHHRTSAEFLAALVYTRAEQLRVPENKVFIAERTDKIVDVFRGLVRHNFLSVPVLQKTKHKWFGFLDLADIVLYVVNVRWSQLVVGELQAKGRARAISLRVVVVDCRRLARAS